MENVTNTRLVENRGTWGKRLTWGGMLVLFGSLFLSFREDTMALSPVLMLAGFLITNVGMNYFNRYVRPPLPQDLLDRATKGLDNRYRLYNYMGPVEHVLLTPSGVLAITVRRMGGYITCKGDKWYTKTSFLSRIRIFAEDQLGSPSVELRRDVGEVQKLLEARLPAVEGEKPVPVGGLVFFGHSATELNLENPTVPVVTIKQIKDYLRKQAAGSHLSPATYEAVATALGG